MMNDHDEKFQDTSAEVGQAMHAKSISVTVNEQAVTIDSKQADGREIKAAAIAQGVLIEAAFILQEELPNGTSRIIGDADVVKLHDHLRFTAIAPDDNS